MGVGDGVSAHIVDVQCTFAEQRLGYRGHTLRNHGSPGIGIRRDVIVLTEDATETTGGEEDGAAGNKGGLLASVKKC